MSQRPLYKKAMEIKECDQEGHWGLWFERFFDAYPEDYNPHRDKESEKNWAKAKSDWIANFHDKDENKIRGDKEACKTACARQRDLCEEQLKGKVRTFSADWHFVTGMGLPHPMENGFLWHPTLGTPYLPGSTVKGILRSWIEAWSDNKDKARLHPWFGSEDKNPEKCEQETQTGSLIFFDALPTSPPTLKADIMTPHRGKWYEAGNDITNYQKQSECIPADWHDPTPIHFLVAHKPNFQFAIAPRPGSPCQVDIVEVMDTLQEALEWIGAGAKTAVGYGWFARNKTLEEEQKRKDAQEKQKAIEIAEKEKKETKEKKKQAEEIAKSPSLIQPILKNYYENHAEQKKSRYIVKQIEFNHWQGQELIDALEWLKKYMQSSGEWREISQKRKPEKDTEHQNTLKIMQWL